MFRPSILVAAAALAAPVLAQANWTQLMPTTSPSPRAGMVGISDGAGVLLFGGKPGPSTELNDLWRFDGVNWTDITPSGSLPPTRDFYAAAFDSGRNRYVLFGGRSGSSELGDTWEYDGASWTQLSPATSPSARRWAAMTYEPSTGRCIMFGGSSSGTYNNETWAWDGTTWTLLSPVTSPSVRGRGFFSYDITRGEALYYGGRNSASALADSWIWDGTTWRQVTTTNAPGQSGVAGLFAYGSTYDLARDRHVLFGGTRTGPTQSATWEFDGSDWSQRAASGPGSRTGPLVVYVLAAARTYLFGGFQGPQLDDTWEYQTNQLAMATAYGAGCAGSGGVLSMSADSLPWLGDTLQVTANNLSPGSLNFTVIGFSNTTWSGGALPVPLSALNPAGGPGCDLLTSADDSLFAITATASQSTSLPIPASASLAGISAYLQTLEIELTGAAGISSINASNGLDLVLGVR